MPLNLKSIEHADATTTVSPGWQLMRAAPKDRPLLLRGGSPWRPEAVVGIYFAAHGGFYLEPVFGQGSSLVNADRWRDIPTDLDAWQSMDSAPRGARPLLLRSRWGGRTIAIVGKWAAVHGLFTTQGEVQVFCDAWHPLPPLEDRV